MADDLAASVQKLRDLHATGLLDDDEIAQKLDRLRARYGAEAVDALLGASPAAPSASSTTQIIAGQASIGVAIGGSHYGHVFLNGYRERSREDLLAAYLGRLADRCAAMPLQGVYGERDTDDTLRLGLDQVYTQLATAQNVLRERFEGEALRAFDAAAYLKRHTAKTIPFTDRRTHLHIERQRDDAKGKFQPATISPADWFQPDGAWRGDEGGALTNYSADQLQKLASDERVVALQFIGPQLVTEAIAEHRCLVLLGEPGGGKSTALRYLARNLARAGVEHDYDPAVQLDGWGELGRLLPIFVPLLPLARQLAGRPGRQGSDADLWNYLADQLQPRGAHEGLANAVMQEIDAGHVILLLDGLDEVAGEESRRQVVQAVHSFAEHNPRCRVVVSCRLRAYDVQINPDNQRWQLLGWPTATLADLTPAQMEHFVGAWYQAVAAGDEVIATQRDERIAELRSALRARPDLHELGKRPLLLTIMALVHLRQRNLPEDRASLYRECVEILLARWELRGKEETEYKALMHYIGLPGIEVKALRPLLAKAAFTAHQALTPDNPGLLTGVALQVMVQQFLHEKGHPNPFDGARRFLDYTDYRAGLIQAAGAGSDYQFAHLTFQEYLAGLALVGDEQPVQAILQRREDERWRVPIFLGIGHAVSEGVPSLFRDLLDELTTESTSERGQRDLLLAAELAADVRWERLKGAGFTKLRRELAGHLAMVVEGTMLPATERVRAGELLGGLGDPREGVCDLPPAMVKIAGGSFVIGETGAALEQAVDELIVQYNSLPGFQLSDEHKPALREWLGGWGEHEPQLLEQPSFELARYPVTNAQYEHFIAAGGYNPEARWWDTAGRAWLSRDDAATEDLKSYQLRDHKDRPESWDDPRFGRSRPNHPVVGVSWYEAMAFGRWLTGHLNDGYIYRLPSEAEWEYAARGSEGHFYPWGMQEPDGERANFYQAHDGTTAVGCFSQGATPAGLLDLAGNVWEWTRSEYKPYPYDPVDGRKSVSEPEDKIFAIRGGGWVNQPASLRASYRFCNLPGVRNFNVGFRLARHLKV